VQIFVATVFQKIASILKFPKGIYMFVYILPVVGNSFRLAMKKLHR